MAERTITIPDTPRPRSGGPKPKPPETRKVQISVSLPPDIYAYLRSLPGTVSGNIARIVESVR